MSDPNKVYLIADSELIELEHTLKAAKIDCIALEEIENGGQASIYVDQIFSRSENILQEVRKSEIGEVYRNRLIIKRDIFIDAMLEKDTI